MRKLFILISLISLLMLVACSESGTSNEASVEANEETQSNSKGILAEEDFDKMYSNPEEYKGYEVEFTGQVFVDPERDDSGIYLQVYAKPEQYEQNTIIAYEDSNFDVKVDDFVKVVGIVQGEFEGENLMGGTIIAPIIEATSIEIVDYVTAVAPTIKEVVVDQTIDQHGLEVTLQKIEFAEIETRVYMKVANKSDDTVYFSNYDAKLISGSSQYESEMNFDSDLPELPYDILPGVEAEGVLTYPTIEEQSGTITLHAEGYSDNWELDFEPYVFEVEVK